MRPLLCLLLCFYPPAYCNVGVDIFSLRRKFCRHDGSLHFPKPQCHHAVVVDWENNFILIIGQWLGNRGGSLAGQPIASSTAEQSKYWLDVRRLMALRRLLVHL